MNCPYCLEEVKAEALVCRTCLRDLAVPKPLMLANQELTERVAELEAEVRALQRRVPREAEAAAKAVVVQPVHPVRTTLLYVVLPVLLLVALHYLLVVRLDARLIWLRVASIALPAVFAFRLEAVHQPRWLLLWPMAIVVAIASVLGMSVVVHLTDGDPIVPQGAVEWRETLEYIASILLAYLLGPLLCKALRPVKRHAVGARGLIEQIASAMAKARGGGKESPKTLEARVERMVKLMNLGISAATAAGAIYTGLKAVVQ